MHDYLAITENILNMTRSMLEFARARRAAGEQIELANLSGWIEGHPGMGSMENFI